MTDHPKPLSRRHARFVAEYLKDLNGTQAYIRAGYAPHSAQVSSCKLLSQPRIRAAVAEGEKRVAGKWQATIEQLAAKHVASTPIDAGAFIAVDACGGVRIDPSKADRARTVVFRSPTPPKIARGR